MTHAQLLLAVTLLQQGLFGGLWLIAARLRLARRPALHWAAATSGVALGMSLILGRGTLPDWLSLQVSNVLIIASLAVLRRGIQVFTRTRPTDGEHAAVVAAAIVVAFWSALAGAGVRPMAIATSAALGFVMLRAAFETRRSLAGEFGPVAARWCAVPAAAFGALFTFRALMLVVVAAAVESSIAAPGTPNLGLTFGSLLFGLVINTTLIAMTVLRLVRRLQYQSDHDGLTGLLNRRAMERELRSEAQRQRRLRAGYAVLSVDIDHFKRINDLHGHAAGDAVLVRVAQALRDCARGSDRVGRMGGEEFCVLLPGVDRAGAERAAERLLRAIRETVHPELGPGTPVTVSIGLAVAAEASEPIERLQRRLDRALYAAKHAGRDRIAPAEAAVPEAATLS